MKSIIYTVALLISGNVSAQICSYTIAPHAEVGGIGNIHITSDTTIVSNDGSNFYICAGVTMVIDYSAGSNYELEDGVTLTINDHDGDNIAAKGNCTIVDNSTAGVAVTMEATSTFSKPNMPLGAALFTCANMVFDYTQVGGVSPCSFVGLETNQIDKDFTVYPNPINGSGELNFGIEANEVQLYDMTGRMVADYQNINSSSIEINLENGLFMVRATSVSGMIHSSRLIVQ